MSLLSYAQRRFTDGLVNSTLDKASRWAEKRIWMPAHNDRPAGWYSTVDFPWNKEILDSRANFNWFMKCSQVGATVAGMVRGCHEVEFYGNDTMYLLPTDRVASLFSKTRMKNLIEGSPYLRERVTDSIEVKLFGSHCLYIRGANGDINVKSTPVSRLVLDEIDEMLERQLWLALERLSGKKDKNVWGMSTPTLPNFGIHKLFLKSTQEHFFFGCPHCTKQIELMWPDSFALRGESVDDPDVWRSFIKCYECDAELEHETKHLWLADGKWRPTATDADPGTRGFSINQLYSTSISPGELAIAHLRGIGDEDARREFHNSKLGQPYVEDGTQVTNAHIDHCIELGAKFTTENETLKVKPADLITLGVDQGSFHHWVAVKWEIGSGSGDINDRAKGKLIGFGRILQDDWSEVYNLMYLYKAKHCVIDFYPDPTNARAFARNYKGWVHLAQYVTGRGAREISVQEDDFGANVVKVDKAGWLSKSLGRVIKCDIHFPVNVTINFRQQLRNQIRTHKRGVDGNYVAEYAKLSDDHYGHALNYAEIALRLVDPGFTSGSDVIETIR